ncbi:ABC transporter substrate-binding protein [Streptomyces sp. NBC_01724]|uniref:ABC transporter substrate-binding protein n=1 Tax=unclassified Streptomyces TaxID=2593676 RepID=UPI002DDAE9B1|nr:MULTISPECIES: ABC transporter substrate-binding protein [unclassified Streptomyces]WSC67899.1 ABC transporter substrate-binding protein [Streptomyces sp. NBC_01760]WTE50194.1 ABC transporter substrate-binding protein [Streptomyces sp. NBC_01620]WTE58283.1 ABC transporter substrate-binding protein [Streptomyces sp. NBC_01617]
MTHTMVRSAIGRRATALAAAALTGALALGSVALAPGAAADTKGTTLRAAMTGNGIDSLNPFLAYFAGSLDVFSAVYPSLNSLNTDGTPAPYLATKWTPSADKLTWTFTLRKGLKWSDGKPITAEDAAWTLNLIRTNEVAGTANGSLVENFASVTAPDATTLVIRTKKPQANTPFVSIPYSGVPIVPKHVWEKHVTDLKDFKNDSGDIVGYGPWTLTAYKAEQYVKYDANKDFVLGAPKFDHLVQQRYKAVDGAVAALRSGQLDYVSDLNSTQFKALQSDKRTTAFQNAGRRWMSVALNSGARTRSGKKIGTGNPALADAAVRRAIALATDKQTLVDKVLDGLGQVGAGYIPPTWKQWAWKPAPGDEQSYDIAKANSLLDEAGYTKGKDGIRVSPKTKKPLKLRLGTHSDAATDTQIATYLTGWMKQIGVELTAEPLSSTKLNDDLAKGDWDLLMDGWGTGPDPTYLLSIQNCDALPLDDGTNGSTDSFHCDKEFDKLFKQQVTEFDPAQRAATVGKMQDILYKADNNVILYYATGLSATNARTVKNLAVGKADSAGVYPMQYTFGQFRSATPVAAVKEASSGSTTLWTGIGIGVLVVAGLAFGIKRRSSADERE